MIYSVRLRRVAFRGLRSGLALGLLWPSVAFAQDPPPLAEIARKEAERRKEIKNAPKMLTNKDLPASALKPPTAASVPPADGQAAPAADQKAAGTEGAPPADSPQRDEKYWRTRITQARETLQRNEMFAAALQSQINGLTTDFVNRDDPYQRAQIGEQRQKALDELARVKNDIENGKKQIADIDEEARRAGAPPGWLR
jgi:hypothetical protein